MKCPKCGSENILIYWDVLGKTKYLCHNYDCKHNWEEE